MGGFSSKDVKEITETTHPHFDQYLQCQSRAFTMGLGSTVVSAALIYGGAQAIRSKITFNPALPVLVAIVGAQIIGYSVTKDGTRRCQQIWQASEEYHTALSEPHES